MKRMVNGEDVDLTAEEIASIQAEQAAYTGSAAWRAMRENALVALQASDVTVLRCVENGVALPPEWAAYRRSLRAISGATAGDPTRPMPVRPAYPAGT